uniref:Uncharacterized protein n=1 Tax=Leersia perrieri TaxID=77586 RepID=A0A0D9WZL3_9ORYZ
MRERDREYSRAGKRMRGHRRSMETGAAAHGRGRTHAPRTAEDGDGRGGTRPRSPTRRQRGWMGSRGPRLAARTQVADLGDGRSGSAEAMAMEWVDG